MALSQAYKAWLGNPDNTKVMLAIVKYYFVPEFGSAEVAGERTLYLSSHKYIGNIGGTDIAFMNRILGSPRFKNELATSSEGSRTTASLGELQVNNADGIFDPWLNYGFDGRDIELYLGPPNGSFATEFGQIFKGKIDRLNIDSNLSLSLLFKDKIAELDKPAITSNYELGVNISYTLTRQKLYNSGTGLYTESTISMPGTAAVTKDLDGKPKPLLFGYVRNIEPVLLDAATRAYQISLGPIFEIEKVYDNGVPIDFRHDLATGVFTAINNTVGTVTCDVKGINTNAGAYSDVIDIVPGAVAAYSLRKLSTKYTGFSIRVRRSSDNLELDIGFDPLGNLDISALKTFIGVSDSAFITKWYDQSGVGRDAFQTTTASQPRIALNGVIDTVNGKPALVFDGNNDWLDTALTNPISFTGGVSAIWTAYKNPTAFKAYETIVSTGSTGNATLNSLKSMSLGYSNDASANPRPAIATDVWTPSGIQANTTETVNTQNTTAIYINNWSTHKTTGTSLVTKNGSSIAFKSYGGGNPSSLNSNSLKLGVYDPVVLASSYFGGSIQEVIVYSSDQNTNSVLLESSAISYFGIGTGSLYTDKLPYTLKYLVCTLGGIPAINFITSILVGTIPIGYYLKERRNILDILDDLIKSIDGYYGFDIDGNFFYGVLAIPSHDIPQKLTGNSASRYGDVVYDNTTNPYTDSMAIKRFILASDIIGVAGPKPTVDRTTGYYLVTEVPNNTIYKATASEVYGELNILGLSNVAKNVGARFARNYTVQTDLASTASNLQREFAAQEWRQKVLDVPGVSVKFLTAPVVEPTDTAIADIDTVDSGGPLTGLDGADLLLSRYVRKSSEIIYQVSFSMFFNTIAEARVGAILKLEDARFGFAMGRLATVTSIELDYLNSQANITAIFYAKPFAGVSDSYKIGNSFYNISGTNTITYPSGTAFGGNDYIQITNPSTTVNGVALFDIGQFSFVRYIEVQPNLNATGKVASIQASYVDAAALSIKNTATSPFVDITRTSNTVATIRYGKTGSLTTIAVPVLDWTTVRFGIIYDFNNNKLMVVYKNALGTSVITAPVGISGFFNLDIPKSIIVTTPTSSAVGITTISPTLVSFSTYFIPWTKITEPAAGLATIFPANLVLLDETGAVLLVETGNDALYVES